MMSLSQLTEDIGDTKDAPPEDIREGCLEEAVLAYKIKKKFSQMKCFQLFRHDSTLQTHSPFFRDSLSLQETRAVLCLPAKDNEKASLRPQLALWTEARVTGTFGTGRGLGPGA